MTKFFATFFLKPSLFFNTQEYSCKQQQKKKSDFERSFSWQKWAIFSTTMMDICMTKINCKLFPFIIHFLFPVSISDSCLCLRFLFVLFWFLSRKIFLLFVFCFDFRKFFSREWCLTILICFREIIIITLINRLNPSMRIDSKFYSNNFENLITKLFFSFPGVCVSPRARLKS